MHDWTVALNFRAALGEGLCWDAQRGMLWFVDVQGQRVACWRPGDLAWQEWATPQRVGWVLPVQGQTAVLAGFQQGVVRLALQDAVQVDWVCRLFEGAPEMRLNDAKADATGAIWAGCMNNDDETRPDGCLYRIDATTGVATVVDTGYCVANGPAIHPSGTWMLHTDSVRRTIFAFDLDVARGALSNRRVWKVLAKDEGYPDGMTFDAAGCLWLAQWGVGCISRFAADGDLLRRVQLPTSHISNLCFGGAGLARLFVTSARVGLSPDQLAAQPLAGALFEVDAQGVRGLAALPARS